MKVVDGKEYATADDHVVEPARPSPAKRRKKDSEPVDIDADPKSSSDYERSPRGSSVSDHDENDDPVISSAEIPSSFGSNRVKHSGPGPQRPRRGQAVTDGSNDLPTVQSPSKRSKEVPARPDPIWEGTARLRKPKNLKTFARPKPQYTSIPSEPPSSTKAPPSKFKMYGELKASTPEKKRAREVSSLPSQHSEGAYDGAENYLDEDESRGVALPAKAKKARGIKRESPPSSQDPPSSSGAGFRMPETFTQGVNKLDNDKAIKAARAKKQKREEQKAKDATKLPDEGKCPMHCGKILPRTLLETLSPDASIREQQAFCHRHQVVDAKEEWQRRKYPSIDWDRLPERLEEDHDDNIHHLLFFPDMLHFRKLMQERIKSGKSRNLLQQHQKADLDYLGAGYYGLKGQEMITAYIGKHFASSVSKRAELDPVMSAQGPMAYIQEVLVLEVVTLLIKEDMKCDDVRAREIMAESTYIGELLWPSESAGGAKRRTRRLADEEQDQYS